MNTITHELIRASAGTGKTYQLTNRYLRILFLTHEPEKVIALTFTRKAAGEFFEKIFRRLADGADDGANAVKLGRELGLGLSQDECRAHLRILLERLHRLQLSTYDSFFSRIVQTFPFELGLAGAPTLLDEEQRMLAIERAQQALSRRTQSEKQFLTDFWHACKRATMGAESKSITDIVTDFILKNHSLFFDACHPHAWGSEATIWEGCCPWNCGEVDLVQEASVLQEFLPWTSLASTQTEYWRQLIQDLITWRPPLELPKRLSYFLPKLLEQYDQLDSGNAVLDLNKKKQTVGPAEGASLKRIAQFVWWSVVKPKLEATQGIFDLVRLFEEVYSREVRLMGQLTLEDATRLLCGGPSHGRGLGDPELREQLGYRLDGVFDHWLLDEFQDTSRTQWRAIADLIDEILQDPESRRSFFAVGDTKQSLYGWRGSDDRLFDRIHQRYHSVLSVRALNQSYRSSPSVLAMVNGVFNQTETIRTLFTPGLAHRWQAMWQPHEAAPALAKKPGYSCLIHAPTDDATRFRTILELLEELKPLEKGLSVAILTQQNDTADALVEYLRAHDGPPCSLAANVQPGSDNVVAAGLRSFVTLAAHPKDTVAWQHLRMTPLREALDRQFPTPAALSAYLLQVWSNRGLVGLVDEWSRLCHPWLDTADSFNRGRLELCRNAAAAAEERGDRDIDLYIRQLTSLSLREHDTPGQVAVMTIYKAKGLDWDIVLLTDLDGKTLLERRDGLEVHRDPHGEIEWVLDMPSSQFALYDPALAARINASKEDAAFESLCVLYVGLTRAKSGLYVITHRAKGASANFHRLLDDSLEAEEHPLRIGSREFTCAWEAGDPHWLNSLVRTSPPPQPEDALIPLAADERLSSRRPAPLLPSAEKTWRIRGNALLAKNKQQRDLGTTLHRALSEIDWLTGNRGEDQRRIAAITTELDRAALAWVESIFISPQTRAAFLRPAGAIDLWREQPFEILIDHQWISGRFDRVVVHRDSRGRPTSARILDLKVQSIHVDDDALLRQHDAQMTTYRHVAARLLGLTADQVAATLLVVETTEASPPRLLSMF